MKTRRNQNLSKIGSDEVYVRLDPTTGQRNCYFPFVHIQCWGRACLHMMMTEVLWQTAFTVLHLLEARSVLHCKSFPCTSVLPETTAVLKVLFRAKHHFQQLRHECPSLYHQINGISWTKIVRTSNCKHSHNQRLKHPKWPHAATAHRRTLTWKCLHPTLCSDTRKTPLSWLAQCHWVGLFIHCLWH